MKTNSKATFQIVTLLALLSLLLTGCMCKHEWVEASCTTPKTCTICETTVGEPAGHAWIDATYTTPKTCSVCNKTEGTKLTAKEAFSANPCNWLYGSWSGSVYIPGSSIGSGNFPTKIKLVITVTFNPDGTYKETIEMGNKGEFIRGVESYYEDLFYEDLSDKGYAKSEADEVMILAYGMNVKSYAKKLAAETDWAAMVQSSKNGVYFIYNEKLYMGNSWSGSFQINDYTYSVGAKCLTIEYLLDKYPSLLLLRS